MARTIRRPARPARVLLLVAAAISAWVAPGACRAGDPVIVSGNVTMVTDEAVWVSGRWGELGPESDVRSDGHPVSRASLRPGMPARMELDDAGRILEIRTTGVVE